MSMIVFLLVIWFLETSCGEKLHHPTECYGHTGINEITLRDINQNSVKKNRRTFTKEDLNKKELAFEASRFHLADYSKEATRDNWDLYDYFLFWRCGISGMHTPTDEQKAYAEHGLRCYSQLMQGIPYWRLK